VLFLAYENGVLVEKTGEPWGRECIKHYAEPTFAERSPLARPLQPVTLTRRERRQLARRGRRFPIRVPSRRHLDPFVCARRIETLVGHRMRRESPFTGPYAPRVPVDFIFYIPDGDNITGQHMADLIAYTDALYERILRSHR